MNLVFLGILRYIKTIWSCKDITQLKFVGFSRSIEVRTLILEYVVASTISDLYIKLYGYQQVSL